MTDWLTSRKEFDEVTAEGNVVVLYTAPAWCVPCQRFEPHWTRATEFAVAENMPVKFFRVDVDLNEWAVLDFGVRGVPACHLWVDGKYERNLKVPQGGLPFLNDIRAELGV